jgi:hypothetical protein
LQAFDIAVNRVDVLEVQLASARVRPQSRRTRTGSSDGRARPG